MNKQKPIGLSDDERSVLKAVFDLSKGPNALASKANLAEKLEKPAETVDVITSKLFKSGFLSAGSIPHKKYPHSPSQSSVGLCLSPKGRRTLGIEQAP